jgi:hypothetical protein
MLPPIVLGVEWKLPNWSRAGPWMSLMSKELAFDFGQPLLLGAGVVVVVPVVVVVVVVVVVEAATFAVGSLVAGADPSALPAITLTRIVLPSSPLFTV